MDKFFLRIDHHENLSVKGWKYFHKFHNINHKYLKELGSNLMYY